MLLFQLLKLCLLQVPRVLLVVLLGGCGTKSGIQRLSMQQLMLLYLLQNICTTDGGGRMFPAIELLTQSRSILWMRISLLLRLIIPSALFPLPILRSILIHLLTLCVVGRSSWLGGLLPILGSGIGTHFGGPIGAALGSYGGGLISRAFGLGDYKVKRNSLMGLGGQRGVSGVYGPPRVQNSLNGIRISHREFISDVKSTTTFENTVFRIQPGDQTVFPWLSQVALNFEQYRFHGLIFEYRATSADALNSTNTALGTVIMGTDYNVYADPFTNKQQMENNEYTTSTKPSNSMMHPIECHPRESQVDIRFTRTDVLPTQGDLRLYDVGNFQFATVGSQAEATIGELWCSYDIEFFKPQISVQPSAFSALIAPQGVTKTSPFGVSDPTYYTNSMEVFLNTGTQSIQIPPGVKGTVLIAFFVSLGTGSTTPSGFGLGQMTPDSNIGLVPGETSEAILQGSSLAENPGSDTVATNAFTWLVFLIDDPTQPTVIPAPTGNGTWNSGTPQSFLMITCMGEVDWVNIATLDS